MGKESEINKTIYKTTSVIGVLLAFGCFEHGLFETLQGFTPTPGNFIQAIGENIRWWPGGDEGAFTIIPNYLITGIVVIVISIFAAFWSIKYIRIPGGSLVFLLSFIALTLSGGGIGHIPFYVTSWAFTLKGIKWWEKRISKKSGLEKITLLWKNLLIAVSFLWLLAIEIAVFGYFPGVQDVDVLLAICWGALLMTLLLIVITYVIAMVIDAKEKMV